MIRYLLNTRYVRVVRWDFSDWGISFRYGRLGASAGLFSIYIGRK